MPIDKNTTELVPFSVLAERGWTREMLKLHRLDSSGQGWSLARAQALEGASDWQYDRARADAGLPLLYSRQKLLAERSWSATMVAEFLLEPDVVDPLGPNRRRHLFAAKRVEAIEATDRFRERAAVAEELSQKAACSAAEHIRKGRRCSVTTDAVERVKPAEDSPDDDNRAERNKKNDGLRRTTGEREEQLGTDHLPGS